MEVHHTLLTITALLIASMAYMNSVSVQNSVPAQVVTVENGVARPAVGIDYWVFCDKDKMPADLNKYPKGTIYACVDIRFSTGHILSRDAAGNLIISVELESGALQPQLTMSKDGAIGMGANPLPQQNIGDTGGTFVTGSSEDETRSGWHSNAITNITDSEGTTQGTMHTVQHAQDPKWKGIQFVVNGASMTLTNGLVVIGEVSAVFMEDNKHADTAVLVGGNVNQQQVTENVDFVCESIPGTGSNACTDRLLRVSLFTAPSRPGNAIGTETSTLGYFEPLSDSNSATACYHMCAPAYNSWLPKFLDGEDPLDICTKTQYIAFPKTVCGTGSPYPTSITVKAYSNDKCTLTGTPYTINLLSYPDAERSIDCWCPSNSNIHYIPNIDPDA